MAAIIITVYCMTLLITADEPSIWVVIAGCIGGNSMMPNCVYNLGWLIALLVSREDM